MNPLYVVANADGVSGLVSNASLDPIMDAGANMITFAGQILSTVVSNPILVVPLGVGFVWYGIGLIRGLFHRAH